MTSKEDDLVFENPTSTAHLCRPNGWFVNGGAWTCARFRCEKDGWPLASLVDPTPAAHLCWSSCRFVDGGAWPFTGFSGERDCRLLSIFVNAASPSRLVQRHQRPCRCSANCHAGNRGVQRPDVNRSLAIHCGAILRKRNWWWSSYRKIVGRESWPSFEPASLLIQVLSAENGVFEGRGSVLLYRKLVVPGLDLACWMKNRILVLVGLI